MKSIEESIRKAVNNANRRQFVSVPRVMSELKVLDTQQSVVTEYDWVPETGPLPILLNGIGQGDDLNQRTGRSVNLKSIQLRLHIRGNPSNIENVDQAGDLVRAAIIWDTQNNSLLPASYTDIFSPIAATTLPTTDSFPVVTTKSRYKILKEWFIPVGPLVSGTGYVWGQSMNHHREIYLDLGNKRTLFSGTGTTIGSIQTGALYFYIFSGSITPSSDPWITYRMNARLRYYDA